MNARTATVAFRDPDEIERAIPVATRQLAAHGVLAYPTETVYGLGGAINAASVDALAGMKGRDESRPFLLLVSGRAMAESLVSRIPDYAEHLIARHWPGPLTLVLEAARALPSGLVGRGGGVAVRWTSHGGIARLIAEHGDAITSTSANAPGGEAAQDAPTIVDRWSSDVRTGRLLVLDGGRLAPSAPSTVVDCTGPRPRLVRGGAISAAALRESVPSLVGSH